MIRLISVEEKFLNLDQYYQRLNDTACEEGHNVRHGASLKPNIFVRFKLDFGLNSMQKLDQLIYVAKTLTKALLKRRNRVTI